MVLIRASRKKSPLVLWSSMVNLMCEPMGLRCSCKFVVLIFPDGTVDVINIS